MRLQIRSVISLLFAWFSYSFDAFQTGDRYNSQNSCSTKDGHNSTGRCEDECHLESYLNVTSVLFLEIKAFM